MAAPDSSATDFSAIWQTRTLLRAARVASLATVQGGQPYVALVTPATAPDFSVLLWLSDLSAHTGHLRAEPRCALLVQGVATEQNPQTAPRLSITGDAAPLDDPALKSRWLAVHPYAALYADFADFSLWRMRPQAAHLVGGFARAQWLAPADFSPDPGAVQNIAAAAGQIIAHCNTDHPDALAAIAHGAGAAIAQGAGAGVGGAPWRMVTVDVDGFDLAAGETTRRIAFSSPIATPQDIRRELIRLAHAGRRLPD